MWTLHSGWAPPEAKASKCRNRLAAAGLRYESRVLRRLRRTDLSVHCKPWLKDQLNDKLCQPDAVVMFQANRCAIIIEIKLAWKEGRDWKLLSRYLPAVEQAFEVDHVRPLMIASSVRGLPYPAETRLLEALQASLLWTPGEPTPVLLMP